MLDHTKLSAAEKFWGIAEMRMAVFAQLLPDIISLKWVPSNKNPRTKSFIPRETRPKLPFSTLSLVSRQIRSEIFSVAELRVPARSLSQFMATFLLPCVREEFYISSPSEADIPIVVGPRRVHVILGDTLLTSLDLLTLLRSKTQLIMVEPTGSMPSPFYRGVETIVNSGLEDQVLMAEVNNRVWVGIKATQDGSMMAEGKRLEMKRPKGNRPEGKRLVLELMVEDFTTFRSKTEDRIEAYACQVEELCAAVGCGIRVLIKVN